MVCLGCCLLLPARAMKLKRVLPNMYGVLLEVRSQGNATFGLCQRVRSMSEVSSALSGQ